MNNPVITTMILARLLVSTFCSTVYVRSGDASSTCPTQAQVCETLNDIMDSSNNYMTGRDIHLIFLPGTYHSDSDIGLKVHGKDTILIEGLSKSSTIYFTSLEMVLFNINVITIKDITIEEVVLSVFGPKLFRLQVLITNCMFIQSSVYLQHVEARVEDCQFVAYNTDIAYDETTLELAYSTVTFKGNLRFINNTGTNGGAMSMTNSKLIMIKDTVVRFINNTAKKRGGAIYVDNMNNLCFYEICPTNTNATLFFSGNTAVQAGDNIYGASLKSDCNIACSRLHPRPPVFKSSEFWHRYFYFNNYKGLSSVAAKPTRVCLCDGDGLPQCTKAEYILVRSKAFPGETLNIPYVLVGGDFGTTTGLMYSHGSEYNQKYDEITRFVNKQTYQAFQNKRCTVLNYTLLSKSLYTSRHKIYLYTESHNRGEGYTENKIEDLIHSFNTEQEISTELRTLSVVLKVSITKCPLGFKLYKDINRCDCNRKFKANNPDISCIAEKGTGYISWQSNAWLRITDNGDDDNTTEEIMISRRCPSMKCLDGPKYIDIINNSDAQCAFNHAGRLCGGCIDGHSLAIGSKRCVHCPNNNGLALLIFFAAAGFLLVLLISIFNLTVTEGAVNGLIFYANIVSVYGSSQVRTPFLSTFIAWLNLDFGIESCFYKGLNSFTKMWLQLLFPFYVASIFFVGIKFSNKLSRIFGSRSVPTLATILFLSSTKLLNIITTSLNVATITIYSENASTSNKLIRVWVEDGRLEYGASPHIYLLVTSVVLLALLWTPYTLLLFSMQWLRPVDHYRLLKVIARYKPVYDAYFAPLNDKHHYWFGTLLLVRGILFMISSIIQNDYPTFNVFILVSFLVVVLLYQNHTRVYEKKSIAVIESLFLVNLIILFTGAVFFKNKRSLIFITSTVIALVKFFGIVLWNMLPKKVKEYRFKKATRSLDVIPMVITTNESQGHKCTYSVVTTENAAYTD